ncbi:MAG: S41 family peptidase, partial [Acidimicrobiia bacterium]|nr:S41 family peptidase [Acidimicrobiia bacterium]
TSPRPPATTAPPPATTATTVIEMRACGSAQSRPWSILCRAHDLIVERSLYEPDSPSLAAAAATGVRRVQPGSGDASDPFSVCYLPDPAFDTVCETIADRHRFEGIPIERLVEGAVQGMFRFGLDPYSSYLTAEQAARLQSVGPGHVLSLGLVVGARNPDGVVCGPLGGNCQLTVLTVFDLGPAGDAGIQPGDVIETIEGAPLEGIQETEAAALLSASPGETTTVTYRRLGTTTEVTLIHVALPAASVEYGPIGPDILYLRLNDLSQQAAQAVGEILESPDAQGISGIVLDLRGNPGGLVLSAQAVASQFLSSGVVLVEETRTDTVELPVLEGGLVPAGVRVAVIVDSGTASSAEILAAALQSAGRATVIGQPTFGKNVVQEVFDAPGGGEFRITVARWFAPNGVDVAPDGLTPDVVADVAGDAPISQAAALVAG